MSRHKAVVAVAFPDQAKIVASVSTTKSMIVLALGDGRKQHYTYPPDGRFHITSEGSPSVHSFFSPGPALSDLSYHRLALVIVPTSSAELLRPFSSTATPTMTIEAPIDREGMLEVGILGQRATSELIDSLRGGGHEVALAQGPRSDTTIVFRYTP